MIASLFAIAMILIPVTPGLAAPATLDVGHPLLAKVDSKEAVVTLANRFTVSKEQLTDFLDRWSAIGAYMKQQPGFVSAELKQDIIKPQEWVMAEQWKSLQAYKKAISADKFQALLQDFPARATWFAQDLFPSR